MAISAWESPGVQMSTICTSSRLISSFQSVSTAAQPNCSAVAVTASRDRPHSTARVGLTGRSKKAPTVRQAWECTRPMKAYPTMPTPSVGLSSCTYVSPRSGLEAERQVLLDVLLGDGFGRQCDRLRYLVLHKVAHALALGYQPCELDGRGGHRGAVGDGGLEHRTARLDLPHGVGRSGAADHEELVAAGFLDGGEHTHALVVVVVPDRVDLGMGLEQVGGDLGSALDGELRILPGGDAVAVGLERVLEALAALLGEGERGDALDFEDDGVGDVVLLELAADVVARRDAHAVIVAADPR